MARPLRELRRLAGKLDVPVICAGDVFDKWSPPAELITFAIQELPEMWAVPGQHDLPHHSYEDIERSGYWTLVEAGVIHNLEPGSPVRLNDLELYGFPWKHSVSSITGHTRNTDILKIAVIHAYCWSGQFKYMTAPESGNIRNFKLSGFDAAVIGDNHIGFVEGKVCNCGGFMRRHKPDLDRQPFVGVLMADGTIKQHLLDTSNDVYSLDACEDIVETGTIELGDFTDSLLGLKDSKDLDFGQVIHRWCKKNKVSGYVVKIIDEAIEGVKT